MRPCLPTLIKARARIADPANWGKGIRGPSGSRLRETCCAAEAIEEVEPHKHELRIEAYRMLREAAGLPSGGAFDLSLLAWNDAAERTHAEVLAAFDKAIEAAS